MCGRARCTLDPQQVATSTGVPSDRWAGQAVYRPSYNLAPGAATPVVLQDAEGERCVHVMRWGLVPSFTKPDDKPDYFRMFNARSESVTQKPAFRRLVSRRRCVVLMNGFFEWKQEERAGKQPYYVHLAGAPIMKFAGLWDTWRRADGSVMESYTILTTAASKPLEWLHDRMPVILPTKDAEDVWLAGGALDQESRIAHWD